MVEEYMILTERMCYLAEISALTGANLLAVVAVVAAAVQVVSFVLLPELDFHIASSC